MPSRVSIDQQIYEAIRASKHGVPFEFITGGVRYKAVLQHKETREQLASASSTIASPIPGLTRRDSKESFDSGKTALH